MNHDRRSGFTTIELLLAMAFLAFMLVFVLGANVQLFRIYNKGGVIKQINQAGRTSLEEMGRSYRTQNIASLVMPAGAQRVCSSDVAYVWNTVDLPTPKNTYTNPSLPPLRLVRITDNAAVKSACTPSGAGYPAINPSTATELLGEQIGVQLLTFEKSDDGRLLRIGLALSTTGDNRPTFLDGGVMKCAPDAAGQFCALSSFETMVYAPNGR